MTLLGDGTLTVRTAEGDRVFRVRRGVLQVIDDTVRVVAEHAEEAKGD
jgi:F0F1-type ATP synthase epsilon subunit